MCIFAQLRSLMKKHFSIILVLVMLIFSFPALSVESRAAFEGQDKINIVLDPGHGGPNVGTSARGIGEKTYTLKLALLIRDILAKDGNFNVYLTRTGEVDLELYQRAEIANSYNADLLISLHFDGSQNSAENGVTAYTSIFDTYALVSLSQSIAQNVSASIGLNNNGVRRKADTEGYYWNFERQWDCQDPSLGTLSDYYGIPTWCAKFGIPSTIIEHGFFSNYSDADKIFAPGNLEKMAAAEAKAIIDYYTNHTHTYGNAAQDFPSNCMYTGKTSQRCTVCGHRINVKMLAPAPNNHYWIDTDATDTSICGVDSKKVRECRITQNLIDKGWEGETHLDTQTIKGKEHSYKLLVEVPATHTEDGYKKWQCSSCKFEYTQPLKAEGHTFGEGEYKAPTCTEEGGYTYKCKACDHSYTDKVAATGHKFEQKSYTEPNCTENGEKTAECYVCNFVYTKKLPALGHSYIISEEVPPTCTEDGYKKGVCSVCNVENTETLKKTGHTYTEKESIPATCEKDGRTVSVCDICEDVKTNTQKKLGHVMEARTVSEPTCTKSGKESSVCDRCGFSEEKELEPLGHKKGSHAITVKEATLFTNGAKNYLCENGCSYTFEETVPSKLDTSHKLMLVGGIVIVLAAVIVTVAFIFLKGRDKADESKTAKESDSPDCTESNESSEEAEDSVDAEEKAETTAE